MLTPRRLGEAMIRILAMPFPDGYHRDGLRAFRVQTFPQLNQSARNPYSRGGQFSKISLLAPFRKGGRTLFRRFLGHGPIAKKSARAACVAFPQGRRFRFTLRLV